MEGIQLSLVKVPAVHPEYELGLAALVRMVISDVELISTNDPWSIAVVCEYKLSHWVVKSLLRVVASKELISLMTDCRDDRVAVVSPPISLMMSPVPPAKHTDR